MSKNVKILLDKIVFLIYNEFGVKEIMNDRN